MAAEAGRLHASETDESGLCRVTAVGPLESWRGIGVGHACLGLSLDSSARGVTESSGERRRHTVGGACGGA